jgi:hypothetical protein
VIDSLRKSFAGGLPHQALPRPLLAVPRGQPCYRLRGRRGMVARLGGSGRDGGAFGRG